MKEKLVHVTLLQPPLRGSISTRFLPDSKHLSVGKPIDRSSALKAAREYTKALTPLKGHVFIEGEGFSATTSVACEPCDARGRREEFYINYISENKGK